MVEMAEDPALLITKWTLQRWKLCLTSLLKDKTAQPKIAAYLKDLFVLYSALTLACQRSPLSFLWYFIWIHCVVSVFKMCVCMLMNVASLFSFVLLFVPPLLVLWALMCHRASSTFQTILVSLANKLSLHRLICNAGDSHRLRRLHHS